MVIYTSYKKGLDSPKNDNYNLRCSHDARNKLGARLTTVKSKGPIKGLLKKMGNKLSCSCGPLKIKGYRFDPGSEPWDAQPDISGIIRRGKSAGPMLK